MALPSLASPYKRTEQNGVLQGEVLKYLGVRDSFVNYSAVDRFHRSYIATRGLPIEEIKIPARLLNHLFEQIHKFPKLRSLSPTGLDYQALVLPNGTGRIDRLTFDGNNEDLPTQHIMSLLEAISLKGLSLIGKWIWSIHSHFQPIEGHSLSIAARSNLALLTDLDLSGSDIDPHGVLELLQSSQNFRSVNLVGQLSSNEIFTELVRKPELAHLNLYTYHRRDVDYTILANCRKLESFTPGADITEEALIAIIQSNPMLSDLDLRCCKKEVLTDQVFQAIGNTLKGLKTIDLSDASKMTDAGFIPLVQGCKLLQSLTLRIARNISADAIKYLKNCPELKELKIIETAISDEVLDAITSIKRLSALSLARCRGFSANNLNRIAYLTNLEFLNLDGVAVLSDAIVGDIVNHCPKLNTLRINCWEADLNKASLNFIRDAIEDGTSDLRNLSCAETGTGLRRDDANQLRETCPKLNTNPHTAWS